MYSDRKPIEEVLKSKIILEYAKHFALIVKAFCLNDIKITNIYEASNWKT